MAAIHGLPSPLPRLEWLNNSTNMTGLEHVPDVFSSKQRDLFERQQHAHSPASAQNVERKRVRRKQSTQNLCRNPELNPPFEPFDHSMYNSSPRYLSERPLSPDDVPEQQNARSPSLSSEATTVPSTPELTPLSLRSLSPEFSILNDAMISSEPIRTKRNFPRFKQAKRLPRWKGVGSEYGPGVGGENNELWEVYAAVFDPAVNFETVIDEGTDQVLDAYYTLEDLPPALQLRRSPSANKLRTVRFEAIEEESKYSEQDHGNGPKGMESGAQNDQTSSLSLFRFQFPPPPKVSHDVSERSELGKWPLLPCQAGCALIDL